MTLSGNGSAPYLGLDPPNLGSFPTRRSSDLAPMTVTLTNTGAAALTINSFAPSGDFAATSTGASACPTSPATLAAGANCTSKEPISQLQSPAQTVCRLLPENTNAHP